MVFGCFSIWYSNTAYVSRMRWADRCLEAEPVDEQQQKVHHSPLLPQGTGQKSAYEGNYLPHFQAARPCRSITCDPSQSILRVPKAAEKCLRSDGGCDAKHPRPALPGGAEAQGTPGLEKLMRPPSNPILSSQAKQRLALAATSVVVSGSWYVRLPRVPGRGATSGAASVETAVGWGVHQSRS